MTLIAEDLLLLLLDDDSGKPLADSTGDSASHWLAALVSSAHAMRLPS